MNLPKICTVKSTIAAFVAVGMLIFSSVGFSHGFLHSLDSVDPSQGIFQPGTKPLAHKDAYAHPYPHPYGDQWKESSYHGDVKIFYKPKTGNEYVDYCNTHDQQCGRVAANKFCQKEGYEFASRFFIRRNIGYTRTIGDNGTHHLRRDGFRLIKCRTIAHG